MKNKTFKRELAVVMLLWLAYIVETKDAQIIEVLSWPIFSYVTAAFGFDAYSRMQQRPLEPSNRRGSERSSQHPTRSEEYPDLGDER